MNKLKKGDRWHIQLGENSTLIEREILEVTKKTVLITQFGLSWITTPSRYVIDEIKFIEKTKGSEDD